MSASAVCSGSRMLSVWTMLHSTKLQIQCHFVSICLDRLWNCRFLAIANAPRLSPINVVSMLCGNPSFSHKFLSQQASHPALESATYSASVDDKATTLCFFDRQVIAPPAARKTYSMQKSA